MDNGRITYLVEQYLNDSASPQELGELENLLADPNADSMVKDAFYAGYYRLSKSPASGINPNSDAKERIFQQIIMQPPQRVSLIKHRITQLPKWLPYAAAVVLAMAVSLLVWNNNQRPPEQEITAAEIAPGTNRATLALADGRAIALDDTQDGIIIGAGKITYNDGHSQIVGLGDDKAPIETLVLSTPKGGTYSIILPDGSKVWLNAATTLKYPSRFDGRERVVYLEGEAYFSVTKRKGKAGVPDDVPFSVVSNGQVVKVLGTEFNISAYPDESETQTTLVTGRVSVSTSNGTAADAPVSERLGTTILAPGEQAINRQGIINVQKADPDQYTAWKDGFFYFDRLSPQIAITQLARWYDLEVVYRGKIPQINIFGMIDRNKSLESVLKSLEKSGLSFKIVHSAGINRLIVLGEQ
ncbi:iron dicitrate transporter FecR [Parapedobacter pyrenivorans]|uniref:Iron dicitrate transporter FecR n=1 Tax=Parapedobacter pyrenivorans TaxID=1305674 RepID=A0A917M5I0_9SPHI|nr:FecR family protein [Parapedobacter pyrenivorans]GGG78448.1 iron dicitrate transporter FecR [Parapedobacter pyrenivorans]